MFYNQRRITYYPDITNLVKDIVEELENIQCKHNENVMCGEGPLDPPSKPAPQVDITPNDFYSLFEKHLMLQRQVDEQHQHILDLAELVKKLAVQVENLGEKS